jgi:hypothetical protein
VLCPAPIHANHGTHRVTPGSLHSLSWCDVAAALLCGCRAAYLGILDNFKVAFPERCWR